MLHLQCSSQSLGIGLMCGACKTSGNVLSDDEDEDEEEEVVTEDND